MKEIIVFAGGGLGNRINTILSALSLYESTHYSLKIIWLYHQEFQSSFEDLFEPFQNSIISIETMYLPIDFTVTKLPYTFTKNSNILFILDRFNQTSINLFHLSNNDNVFLTDTPYHIDSIPNYNEYTTIVFVSPKFLPVQTTIQSSLTRFFTLFKPIKIQTILQFLKSHSPSIGIHIRLTDKCTINNYTSNDLQNDIDILFPTFISNKVFICSDDLAVEKKILELYPNCVHYKKYNDYNLTKESINRPPQTCVEAIIDFFIFCACKQKFGINSDSIKSTFFEVANLLQDSFIAHYDLNQ